MLLLKVLVPAAEHMLWLLPFCYLLSFPGRDASRCIAKKVEICGQGREDEGKESEVIDVCIDTGVFLTACITCLPPARVQCLQMAGRSGLVFSSCYSQAVFAFQIQVMRSNGLI